ncbi:MAG: ABC transporter permease [Clostridia bacterium]|nr:ABC transporter permease [Clostridia bacterium]
MNVFNKVTLQSLKKNRTRTIVTIIGIMLSAAMICAVTTFTSSMQKFTLDYAIYMEGDWHSSMSGVTTEEFEKISNDERVSQCTYAQGLGYAKIESENKYKPYINIVAGDEAEFFNMLPVRLVSGRLPQSSDEIIISEHFYADGNSGFKEGDTVTLEMGERTSHGLELGQYNPIYTYDPDTNEEVLVEEEFVSRESRTYTVVGICKTNDFFEDYHSPGYTAFTVSDGKPVDDVSMDIYYKMNKPSEVYSFAEEFGVDVIHNTDVLMYMGVSHYESFFFMLAGLAAVVIILIVLGAVSLIYNAFSISVSERTKQFGLLSSIGATKKQLRKMVLFEALAVSAVGIPLGILVGIGGIGITLMLIGHKFNSMIGGVPIPMRICVTWQGVLIAVIIAVVTVLISAWIPSIRATRVSAVEAIRQNADVKAKQKHIKTSKLTYKLFGLPGVLAVKQFKRNRKKYRVTVISLFMSVVLFISASAFTEYLVDSVTTSMTPPAYDLAYTVRDNQMNGKTSEEILKLLMADEYVTKGTYAKGKCVYGDIPAEYVSDQVMQVYGYETEGLGYVNNECAIYFADDAEFKKILKDNHLNEEDFYSTDAPVAIAQDVCTFFDRDSEKYVTLDIIKGDECEVILAEYKPIEGYYVSYTFEENGKRWVEYCKSGESTESIRMPYDECVTEHTLKSVKTIEETAVFMDTSNSALNLVYPISMMDKVLPESERAEFDYCTFYLESDNHAESFESIQKTLSQNGFSTQSLHDAAADSEMDRNFITIIRVFAYGFVILISLVSVANVFNTISTNISLRRREFAMLKSVGMTQKGFNKMMNFECLLYGIKALALGLPVSFGVTYLIYCAIIQGFGTNFYLPVKAIAIAVISVFLVVFVTMMYAMRKIKKDNPIDALKNENL